MATGNGLRMDDGLRAIGLDLDEESRRWPERSDLDRNRRGWHADNAKASSRSSTISGWIDAHAEDGRPRTVPALWPVRSGCPEGAKWDARRFVDDALRLGANVVTRSRVERPIVEDGAATGVIVRRGIRRRFQPADLVVLEAGGLGTPPILERSGIRCDPTLVVDPVLTVAGRRSRAWQCKGSRCRSSHIATASFCLPTSTT